MKMQTIGRFIYASLDRLNEVDLNGIDNDEITFKLSEAKIYLQALLDTVDHLTNKGYDQNHE